MLAKTEIPTVWPLAKVCLPLRDTILTFGSSPILREPEPALKVTSHLHCNCELSGSSILLFSQMSHQFPSVISRFVAWGSLFSGKLKSDNVRSSDAQQTDGQTDSGVKLASRLGKSYPLSHPSARAHFIAPKFSPTEAVRSFPGRLEKGTFQYRQRCRDSALDVAGPGLQTFFVSPSQAAREAEHRTRSLGISVSNGIFNQRLAGDTSCGHAARLGALTLMSSHFPLGPHSLPWKHLLVKSSWEVPRTSYTSRHSDMRSPRADSPWQP